MIFLRGFHRIHNLISDLKIQQKLLLSFLVLTIIPLMIIGTLAYYKSTIIIQRKTSEYTIDILNEVSNNIEVRIREINRVYYTILSNTMVQSGLIADDDNRLNALLKVSTQKNIDDFLDESLLDRDDVDSVFLLSLKHELYQSGPSDLQLGRSDESKLQTNKGNLIWLTPNPELGVVPAGSVINSVANFKPIGYFVVYLKESALANIYNKTKLNGYGDIFIVNSRGRLVSGGQKNWMGTTAGEAVIKRIVDSRQSTGTFNVQLGRIDQYATYHAIGNTGWKIVSLIPVTKYEREIIALRRWMMVIIVICFVLGILLSYVFAAGISRPIRQLSGIMKNVERERFDVYSDYLARNEVGLLSRNFNRMLERINTLINKVYQEQLLKQRAELKYLMFQINPHFLFNTLETINWMARLRGVPEVGQLSKMLGDLMREGIKGKVFIPLQHEIDNIRKYLYIQNMRYGDKFTVSLDLEPATLAITVPKLILQPLVENAIVHGIELKMGKGRIEILSCSDGQQVTLEVRDDGVGLSGEKLAHLRNRLEQDSIEDATNIGLVNVNQRLKLYYGQRHGIRIESRPGEGTSVIMTLPLASMQPMERAKAAERG